MRLAREREQAEKSVAAISTEREENEARLAEVARARLQAEQESQAKVKARMDAEREAQRVAEELTLAEHKRIEVMEAASAAARRKLALRHKRIHAALERARADEESAASLRAEMDREDNAEIERSNERRIQGDQEFTDDDSRQDGPGEFSEPPESTEYSQWRNRHFESAPTAWHHSLRRRIFGGTATLALLVTAFWFFADGSTSLFGSAQAKFNASAGQFTAASVLPAIAGLPTNSVTRMDLSALDLPNISFRMRFDGSK